MHELRNSNEIFRKDVTYDNIKSHEKTRVSTSLKNTFLENPQGREDKSGGTEIKQAKMG